MNFKTLLLLSGTSLLLLSTSAVFPSFNTTALAETKYYSTKFAQSKEYEQLNLTNAQKAKIKEIRESSRQQMKAIFTPEQQEQLRTAKKEHKRPNLNLTEEQQTQLRAIRKSTRSQIQAVLTPEQQQKLHQLRHKHSKNE